MHILIIEDEKKVANALREGLEAEHYEVTIAATGEDGFFLASQRSYDLLLLDLMLPRRDGIDVLATLRNYLRHSGSVVSREMLARDVWHSTARATPLDNVIDVTVARLRRKIDEPCEKKLLHTIRGVGYMLSGRQE